MNRLVLALALLGLFTLINVGLVLVMVLADRRRRRASPSPPPAEASPAPRPQAHAQFDIESARRNASERLVASFPDLEDGDRRRAAEQMLREFTRRTGLRYRPPSH